MHGILKRKTDLSILINPFYIYCLAFLCAILLYQIGWCNIFPSLSISLILFFAITFILFIVAGRKIFRKSSVFHDFNNLNQYLSDIIFLIIILLGVVNVLYMGYLPVLDRTHNYKEFGMPVIDPIFNTLSIFFSVILFHQFLDTRRKRYLLYFIIILILQIILFRRATIVWIVISTSLLYILYKKKINFSVIVLAILLIPLGSYCFGLYGNTRSKLSRSFVMNDLGASEAFKKSGISYNHYMTYLYISSPLANLQKNIDQNNAVNNPGGIKDFLFYAIIPESFTLRLERPLHLVPPSCYLISPNLIVGSLYMVSFYTLGWFGMTITFLYLFIIILLCQYVSRRWSTFESEALSVLCTTVSLLIFSNFLNRLDVILLLFVYPVIFHVLYKRNDKIPGLTEIQSQEH
jgi:hypothetical protein